MNRTFSMFFRGAAIALGTGLFAMACVEQPAQDLKPAPAPIDDPTQDFENQPGVFAGGEDNTASHMGDLSDFGAKDPFEILAQRQEEGPAEIRTRMHSCQKLQNAALRNVLASLGVNMDATGADPPTAGDLFQAGGSALGAASYDARVGEAITWSAAGAAKLFDILVQASPEIIANLPNAEQCKIDGVGVEMFDAQNKCNADAITCITGRPAMADHVAICNGIVTKASTVDKGKRIAVASIMAAAFSCE